MGRALSDPLPNLSLDRYNRTGITFMFDGTSKTFSYDGRAWREIIQRYPRSPEATEARKRLAAPANVKSRAN